MNKWIKVAALSMALPLSLSVNAQNMEMGQGHHRGGMKQIMTQLDLSDAQQQQVRDIMQQMKGSMDRASRQAMRAEHQAERLALLTAPEFDEAKAKDMIERHQATMTERKLQMLRTQHEIYQVLTPEQQAKFADLMAQGKGRGKRQ
ncbi:Spy/CpxP family protein refolding chaperone [Motilimonas eburnea]|uniref:Spy/CpxP family protein refolding chaperone n=1 Tax=Motilimonas eburnea TaxID=1737488 RepID=UPI001E3C1113|nr:Spy/CpxP family protein refolding chaperone [Motilimonas eburnea]MCE2572332.1 Spy/CpxP family protein refolding chaperone [Motilimonas eburnea]